MHKRRNSVDIKRANTRVFDAELKRQIDSRMSERVSREKQQQEKERKEAEIVTAEVVEKNYKDYLEFRDKQRGSRIKKDGLI